MYVRSMATYYDVNTLELIQENINDGSHDHTLTFMNPTNYVQSPSAADTIQHLVVHTTTGRQHHEYVAAEANEGGLSLSLSSAEDIRVSATSSLQSSCKYLKAAKELLDEVVKVDNGPAKYVVGESSAAAAGAAESNGGGNVIAKGDSAEEIQMKKAKLVNMLHQVEQRYKQYKQHMQMLTSWFEQMAGITSSKTYTALALQTISKQFRNLKDAILAQIRVTGESLGEEDAKMEGSRALQQLGMINHNASRQQRGLPEPSVSLLRAWLFQHFFHPYPKDLDKVMLAKQTGLTRSQVSNWFINARVRLWKPMVEELYAEEMKEHRGSKTEQNDVVSTSSSLPQTDQETLRNSHACEIRIPKKQACNAAASMNVEIEKQESDGFTLTNFTGGFGSYPIMEFGAPYSGNGVSLSLGLPHSGSHQIFIPDYNFTSSSAHSAASVYENIDIQSPKRFGPTFLLD